MFNYLALLLFLLYHCNSIVGGAFLPNRGGAFLPNRAALRAAATNQHTTTGYSYTTEYIDQDVDHFSFGTNRTFKQRYLINKEHWREGGPVFFYCGNEGDITWFCNNTGFMWELAPEYHAMLVFAEHRYYGNSLPYGNRSYDNLQYLAYLTSEQALADFAVLIKQLGDQHHDPPFVAFGGSYGGMLAAWLRMKYPSSVIGSIAASAPIWQFTGLVDCERPFNIISELITSYGPQCATNVKNSWVALDHTTQTTGGLEWLQGTFHLCHPLKKNADLLRQWLQNMWFELAEVNYPYPASFLQPLPAWPMKAVCSKLLSDYGDERKLLSGISSAVQVYYNYTGQNSCLDITGDTREFLGVKGWNFQSCTEMVMPMCSNNNSNDVFPKQPWNLKDVISGCVRTYNVTPRPMWVETSYGGKTISATNIVFSNGQYDPWKAGGVVKSLSDTLVAVVIDQGGHHVDLRGSNPNDTESIKHARQVEKENIKKWLTK